MIRITTDKKVREEKEQMMNSYREREELNERHREMMMRIYELEKRVSRLEGTNRVGEGHCVCEG